MSVRALHRVIASLSLLVVATSAVAAQTGGLGAEVRLIPFLPLRAGVGAVGDGMRYSGGLGLELGVVNLQLAAAVLQAEGRNDTVVGVTVSLFGR